MLKISVTAVIFSIAIHLVVYYFISLTTEQPYLITASSVEPIKGYLYQRPVKQTNQKKDAVTVNSKVTNKLIKKVINEKTTDKRENNLEQSSDKNNKKTPQTPSTNLSVNSEKQSLPATKILPEKVTNLTAFTQLKKLRSQLTNKHIKQHLFEYGREKTGSLLHGSPIAVAKSVIKQTEQQYAQQNTTQYGTGLSVQKNKNGNCTIISDLSNVGIEGVTARSHMACGETNDDKSYRLHMDKVLKKLGKN